MQNIGDEENYNKIIPLDILLNVFEKMCPEGISWTLLNNEYKTTNVVSSNPTQARYIQYNIMW